MHVKTKALACVLAGAWLALPAGAQGLQLITADEARLPPAAAKPPSRAITRGPGVKLLSPEAVAGAFPLKLSFEPRGGAKVDAASVKVEYLKGPGIDLTERIKAGIQPGGIDLPAVSAPSGQHPIRVTVRDDEGRLGTTEFTLTVK